MIIVEILLFFCIFQMLLGVLKGDNIPCKVMSFCCLTNYVVVLFCFWGLSKGKESFIDIAYIYVLLGFIINLVLTKLRSFHQSASIKTLNNTLLLSSKNGIDAVTPPLKEEENAHYN